ncbi:MAG TPA: Fe-S protein assembly co-chaperone HscB [Planctomycetia bacterium]|nr:Fe-S protein assembly co-chaperone HscB [Planctomycetia bacterium]
MTPSAPSPNHFATLGLPERFKLDPEDLEIRHLRRSREVHPDAGELDDPAAQLERHHLSAALNEAHRVLSDPVLRAEHLLALHGGPAADSKRALAPAFLAEVLELREELEEGVGPERRTALADDLAGKRTALLAKIATLFADAERKESLGGIRQALDELKYLDGMLRELDG